MFMLLWNKEESLLIMEMIQLDPHMETRYKGMPLF